ncbi:unnamed protein product [Rotaria sordida]|uniref:F-box domain-containing protein n=1 Tax=Rotaria sordida TaxID=392033 RepID=A0A814Q3B6_9BILA|nr:unnamed protein product [Rotaria sordida]
MSKDTKRLVSDIEFDSSSMKRVRHNITCLLDLPDEIFLLICLYLTPACVLYSFYTPEKANFRLHRIIFDYYTNIKFEKITNGEFNYLLNLLCNDKRPLRPESLTFSNEHIANLMHRYFNNIDINRNKSIFVNLKSLILVDCSSNDLDIIAKYYFDIIQIEYLNIIVRKHDDHIQFGMRERYDAVIHQFLFGKRICSLHKVIIDIPDGLVLCNPLVANQYLQNIDLALETIDDLYLLLGGLLPNIEKMIIQLRRSRILSCRRPHNMPLCPRLTEFTLLEPGTGLIIDDMKSIFGYMPNLIKLTLSIRDTLDPTFCHGPKFESILIGYLSDLRRFDYTMTHRIGEKTLIEDFIIWTMNSVSYDDENSQWIHIYSFPWPSSKDDKRELPFSKDEYNSLVTSQVEQDQYMKHIIITEANQLVKLKRHFRRAYQITTCLSIDIELPLRISKVILTKQIPISSVYSIVQTTVRHLIVERRLNDEREVCLLARQFPNVEYLKLLFPLEKSACIRCFQTLFSIDETIYANRRLWHKLINFSTGFFHNEEINKNVTAEKNISPLPSTPPPRRQLSVVPSPKPPSRDISPKPPSRDISPKPPSRDISPKPSASDASSEPSNTNHSLQIANMVIEQNSVLIDMVPSSFNPHKELDDDGDDIIYPEGVTDFHPYQIVARYRKAIGESTNFRLKPLLVGEDSIETLVLGLESFAHQKYCTLIFTGEDQKFDNSIYRASTGVFDLGSIHLLATDSLPTANFQFEIDHSYDPEIFQSEDGIKKFVHDFCEAISKVLFCDNNSIRVFSINKLVDEEGKSQIKFGLTTPETKRTEQLAHDLQTYARSGFESDTILQYVKLKEYECSWKSVLSYLQIRPGDLDPRFNFDYRKPGLPKEETRGCYPYHFPLGWYRHALKVLNKYGEDNTWIGRVDAEGEWPVAFHGTRSGAVSGIVEYGLLPSVIKTDAMKEEAIEAIGEEANRPGFYVATHCEGGSSLYTAPFTVTTFPHKSEEFRIVFQCRVQPGKFTTHKSPVTVGEAWRIVDPSAIRPYGILLKKEGSTKGKVEDATEEEEEEVQSSTDEIDDATKQKEDDRVANVHETSE